MHFMKELWRLIGPFWTSSDRWKALALLAGAVGCHVGLTLVGVGFNLTSGALFNAIQDHDLTAFLSQLLRWGGLFILLLLCVVHDFYFTQLLTWRWRGWMTRWLIDRWLAGQNYYRLQLAAVEADNPDQRIGEDVALFVDKTLDLFTGMIHAVLGIGAFAAILWRMSSDFAVFGFHLPGLLLWAAVLYSLLGSLITHLIGRRLPGLDILQQKTEADFRFSLVRVRENAGSIALMGGAEGEGRRLKDAFSLVMGNWLRVIRCKKGLVLANRAFGQMSGNVAYLIMAPRYFAGGLPLGALVQANQAFIQIDVSLNWIIQNYQDISLWLSAVRRLSDFQDALARVEGQPESIRRHMISDDGLSTDAVSLHLPGGGLLADNLAVRFPKGSRTVVTGPSGCGKSTLLGAIAGLWPHGGGRVLLPQGASLMFLPQRPYLPVGSLRTALDYPDPPGRHNKPEIAEILERCRLEHLIPRLNEAAHWQQRLSPGEMQRLGFARAMLTKPDFLFLDEATSALDEADEAILYRHLFDVLPKAAIVSVAHRESVGLLHSRRFDFAT